MEQTVIWVVSTSLSIQRNLKFLINYFRECQSLYIFAYAYSPNVYKKIISSCKNNLLTTIFIVTRQTTRAVYSFSLSLSTLVFDPNPIATFHCIDHSRQTYFSGTVQRPNPSPDPRRYPSVSHTYTYSGVQCRHIFLDASTESYSYFSRLNVGCIRLESVQASCRI